MLFAVAELLVYMNITNGVDCFAVFVESDFSPVMNTALRGMFLLSFCIT